MSQRFSFVALEVALQLVEILAPALKVLKAKNKNMADQMQRALESVVLNLAEGSRSQDGNRARFFWIASGSLEEVVAALRLVVALDSLDAAILRQAEPVLDRLRSLVWGLTHPRPPATGGAEPKGRGGGGARKPLRGPSPGGAAMESPRIGRASPPAERDPE